MKSLAEFRFTVSGSFLSSPRVTIPAQFYRPINEHMVGDSVTASVTQEDAGSTKGSISVTFDQWAEAYLKHSDEDHGI